MSLNEITFELIEAIHLYNSGEKNYSKFTGFATGENGRECIFSVDIENFLSKFSKITYDNLRTDLKIDYEQYRKLVRKVLVELFTQNKLDRNIELINQTKKNIKKEVEILLEALDRKHVNYIAANTLQLESIEEIKIGCVVINTLDQWIDKVDFNDYAKESYLKQPKENFEWKSLLKQKISDKNSEISGLAVEIYNVIAEANSVIKVTVEGIEQELSKKLSKILAKAALDMISLVIGSDKTFFQQIIHSERLGPIMTYDLLEFNGYLGGPGSTIEKQRHPVFNTKEDKIKFRKQLDEYLAYFEYIVNGFTGKQECGHPKLATKWVYALIWYAEGVRESNDLISVAKLASCFDTLSHGSKNSGIKKLLCNILNSEDNEILFGGAINSMTIHEFVSRFYDDGRSRILHGTIENLLESFSIDKQRLINCGRIILLECAIRLSRYKGEDNEYGFQTMK